MCGRILAYWYAHSISNIPPQDLGFLGTLRPGRTLSYDGEFDGKFKGRELECAVYCIKVGPVSSCKSFAVVGTPSMHMRDTDENTPTDLGDSGL